MTSTQLQPEAFDGSVFGVDEVGSNGVRFRRHTWLKALERRLPRGTTARVTVQTTTIPPSAATEWRLVNGVTYSMVLAGDPTVCWADGAVEAHPPGSAFTLDIARVHRIENASVDRAAVLLTLLMTSADRDHVIPVIPPAETD